MKIQFVRLVADQETGAASVIAELATLLTCAAGDRNIAPFQARNGKKTSPALTLGSINGAENLSQ